MARDRDRDKGSRKFRKPKKKVCQFCTEENIIIDYKNTSRLRKFISDRGKILPRRHTGTCAKHQRKLTITVKRARMMALLPFTSD